jgi:hypothetical protein
MPPTDIVRDALVAQLRRLDVARTRLFEDLAKMFPPPMHWADTPDSAFEETVFWVGRIAAGHVWGHTLWRWRLTGRDDEHRAPSRRDAQLALEKYVADNIKQFVDIRDYLTDEPIPDTQRAPVASDAG